MKEIFTLLIIGLSSTFCHSQFRSTKWGMSLDEVEAVEGLKLYCDSNGACVSTEQKLLHFNVRIMFVFNDDKLLGGGYGFYEEHTNENLYIEDFNKVMNILEDKYGEADEGGLIWNDDSGRDIMTLGWNLSAGNCYYDYKYITDDVVIGHSITTDQYKVLHTLTYRDPNYEPDLSGF